MTLISDRIKKILVINAHADDMEFGCGATIAKLIKEGKEVYNLVLSLRKKTVPKDFPKENLIKETIDASKIIGLKKENNIIKDYENRIFPAIRQEILDEIYSQAKKIRPDLVFTTSLDDTHQDHRVVAEETFRALKHANIISYGFPWNAIFHRINFYSAVKKDHLVKKIKAIQCYRSQIRTRVYFRPEYIKSLAITQGTNIKKKYAESFEVIRWIDE
jgi:LmbE family N-acetylglucosaminyl deacetylase